MPSESWPPNLATYKSIESLKKTFKQRLDIVLYKQLTVDNIETFADDALSETIKLTEDILAEYRINPNVYPNQIPIDKQKQEDEAFAILGLPNISEILQSIIDVKEKIDALRIYLSEPRNGTEEIIIPPQSDAISEIKDGSGKGIEEKKLIPRLLTLLYILETDFDIPKEQVKITEGKVAPNMVRQTPYVRVEIVDLSRIIYICDEEGNASYVFDADKLKEAEVNVENLDISDKSAINNLLARYQGIGARIVQTKHWRAHMAGLLENPIPEKAREKNSEQAVFVSEFAKKEKKELLPFDKFQQEVKTLYTGEGNVQRWYHQERKNHSDWPSTPNRTYRNFGWVDWSKLVEKENKFKKEFLSFDVFEAEVKDLYYERDDVPRIREWYEKERSSHSNWPSSPQKIYKDNGWKSWLKLVGRENRFKREYPFLDFQKEIRTLYKAEEKSVEKWYYKEKPNHPNWPSRPQRTYKNRGWQGWPELVGKENRA